MKKIYISPSNQEKNLYAVGNTNEAVQCNKIGNALAAALERCGFETMVNGKDNLSVRCKESDKWGANLHLPIHTNAHNGMVKGTRLFCYDKTGAGHKACMSVIAALAPITPGESDSVTVHHFYEVKHPKAPTVYVEVGFHDNKEEAAWIIEHTEDIAEAICRGLCAHYGVDYVAPGDNQPEPEQETVKPEEPEELYRVQVGAFAKREYAQALLDKLQAAGFDGFIT